MALFTKKNAILKLREEIKKLVKRIKVSNKRHAHQITKVVCVCTTRVQCKYSICIWDANKLSFMSRTKTANRLHAPFWLQWISFSDEFRNSLIHKVEMVRYCVVLFFAVFVLFFKICITAERYIYLVHHVRALVCDKNHEGAPKGVGAL